MVSLLRCYQKEVDRLTARAKQGEEAFFEVFQVLSKVPSTEHAKQLFSEVVALAASASRLDVQNKKLLHDIEGYKADFKELTSQELTLRKQEDLIAQYEQDLKRLTSEGAIDAEKKAEGRFTEEIERQLHMVAQLKAELKNANESATAALRERDIAQAQILSLESRHSREMQAKQAEVDMIASELDSLSHTLAEQRTLLSSAGNSSPSNVSRQLSLELSQGTPSKLPGSTFSHDSMSAEFDVEKDLQIARLTDELQSMASELESLKEINRREATEQETMIEELSAKLAQLPTPEEWRKTQQRMEVLSGLEAYMGVSESELSQGVDVILRDKVRKLERANLELKATVKSLESQISEAQTVKSTYQLQVSEKDAQIAKMEDAISRTASAAIPSSSASSSAATTTSTSEASTNSTSMDNLDSMVQILKSQRDRLKLRVESLEAEKDRLSEQARLAQVKANSLQEDNVNLYQKLRYLQSFRPGSSPPPSSSSSASTAVGGVGGIQFLSHPAQSTLSATSASGDIESGRSSVVEDKYKSMYEDKVNPFAAFNDRERSKRVESLNPAEKLILASTSFFMATKNTRMVLFAYLILIHVIVMFISYRSAVAHTNCNKSTDV